MYLVRIIHEVREIHNITFRIRESNVNRALILFLHFSAKFNLKKIFVQLHTKSAFASLKMYKKYVHIFIFTFISILCGFKWELLSSDNRWPDLVRSRTMLRGDPTVISFVPNHLLILLAHVPYGEQITILKPEFATASWLGVKSSLQWMTGWLSLNEQLQNWALKNSRSLGEGDLQTTRPAS